MPESRRLALWACQHPGLIFTPDQSRNTIGRIVACPTPRSQVRPGGAVAGRTRRPDPKICPTSGAARNGCRSPRDPWERVFS